MEWTARGPEAGVSWGVFEVAPGLVHVAPCSKDGELKKGHRLDDACPCGVRMVPGDGPLDPVLRTHYDPRWPGSAYPMQA